MPRLVVVQRLLREQLPLEEAAVAIEVGLREREIGFARTNGRSGNFLRRLLLLDLLDELEILNLGAALALADLIARPVADVLKATRGTRRDRNGAFTNQVANDRQLGRDACAFCNGGFDGHRPTAAAAPVTAAAEIAATTLEA